MAQQPQVTRVAPSTGDPNGGQSTTIEGSGFDGLVTVTFESAGGSTKEIANVANSGFTQITLISPPGTSGDTVDVIVTTGAGSSQPNANSKYTYQ
jgi:hypothetical protein